MHDDSRDQPPAQRRVVRLAFSGMALAAILAGIAIWQFADALGLDEYVAKLVAMLFVIVGISDVLLVTFFWDRLFTRRS